MENKETFDSVANQYDKYRPLYPAELFEDILNYSKIQRDDRILEIGCGTGQATSGFISRGFTNLTGIELGANLARITAEKFKTSSKVKIVNSSFEEWHAQEEKYNVAISATAFHFIEPSYGYKKVSSLLSAGGSKAFFWTVHVPLFDELSTEIRALYRDIAPNLDDSIKPSPDEVIKERQGLTQNCGFFDNIVVKRYEDVHLLSAEEYISLLNTHSKHRQLPEDKRVKLFNRMMETIDRHGGNIRKVHLVALFLGTKAS